MKMYAVMQASLNEADAIYHNASTLHINFESDEKYNEQFEDFLYQEALDVCEYLSEKVYKNTGRRYTFAQYGRSGATIAPSEWYVDNMVQKGINTRKLTSGLTGLDLYNEARHIYYVLRITNQAVYARKKQLIKLWQEYLRES